MPMYGFSHFMRLQNEYIDENYPGVADRSCRSLLPGEASRRNMKRGWTMDDLNCFSCNVHLTSSTGKLQNNVRTVQFPACKAINRLEPQP